MKVEKKIIKKKKTIINNNNFFRICYNSRTNKIDKILF